MTMNSGTVAFTLFYNTPQFAVTKCRQSWASVHSAHLAASSLLYEEKKKVSPHQSNCRLTGSIFVSRWTAPSVNTLGAWPQRSLVLSSPVWLEYVKEKRGRRRKKKCSAVCSSWVTDRLLSLSQRWLAGPNISHCLLMKSPIKPSAWSLTHTWACTHTQFRNTNTGARSTEPPAAPAEDYPRKTLLLLGRGQITFQSHSHFFFFM